jgi:hypothetical protein
MGAGCAWCPGILSWNPTAGSEELWSEEHNGPFMSLMLYERFERDGKRFMTLVSPQSWAIEVELTDAPPFAIRALSPDEAWRIGRAMDAQADPPIDVEP